MKYEGSLSLSKQSVLDWWFWSSSFFNWPRFRL